MPPDPATYTAGLTADPATPTVSDMADAVCWHCGGRLEVVDGKHQHTSRATAGRDRGHDPQPVSPDEIPADRALDQLYSLLKELRAERRRRAHPAVRDRMAVEVTEMAPWAMLLVRQEAADEAVPLMGLERYGRLIGVTKQAVHKVRGKRRT